ncbi:MAG: porin family protein [Chitinophagaceae bacterium]|nr:porin family protein [Chitinophagaceae bacterium]
MKKIYLVAAALLSMTAATFAQTQKGYYIIGGQLSNMNLDLQKNGTAFSLNVTPRVAWFIQDNFAVGGEVLIGLNTLKGSTQFNYGIGPIARYYVAEKGMQLMKKTNFFVDANIGVYGQNSKSDGNSSVSTNGLGVGIGPGLAYFINQNISIEGLLKFRHTSNFGNSINVNKNSSAINLAIGFQIHLPGSKLKQMRNEVKQ